MERWPPRAVWRVVDDGIVPCERGIEQEHAAMFGATVVTTGHHHEAVRIAGDGTRAAEEGGEVGTAAVERELSDAVGIHRHELAREIVLEIGVLPAGVADASVIEDGGGVVGVLLKGELDGFACLAVHTVEHAHGEVPVLAGEELIGARAEEDNLVAIRQVAGVPPLDVEVFGG